MESRLPDALHPHRGTVPSMPAPLVRCLAIALVLLGCASTVGCGTVAGWSTTEESEVSRLFIGTRVDATWMTNTVPASLDAAFWGLRFPVPEDHPQAVARCWYFLDMPFAVAADLLLSPIAVILLIF
jgi:uncharacterized protein YceK